MSEQRKRLTDDDVRATYNTEQAAHRMEVSAGTLALHDDHLQARDFVKRLATRLRQVSSDGHDHRCASQRFQPFGSQPACDCETGRLLAEVDPT